MSKSENNVLVALMNNPKDFAIAQLQQWYRIPVKNAPPIIKENIAKIIAFYHTVEFEKEKFSIRWFGEITNIKKVKRQDLFPNETLNEKTDKEYYKIEFTELKKLHIPIISLRPRRILFIPTTEEKFFSAKEINFLFNTSRLEDKFHNSMMKKNVYPERQYFLSVNRNNFFLDFALFCKTRNINVEVDGDYYHMKPDAVQNDKTRNNLLESQGWSVLRFTSKDVESNIVKSMKIVMETVNKYGGIQDARDPESFNYFDKENGQKTLF